jgi:hypothetical protein
MQIINRNSKDYAPIKFDKVISNENRNNFTIIKHEENKTNSIHLKGCLLPDIKEVHTPTNGVIQITKDTRILIDIMQNSARISTYEKEYLVVFAFKLIDFMYMETNQRLPDKEFKLNLAERISTNIEQYFMTLTDKEIEFATEKAILGDFGEWMGISVANWTKAIKVYLNSKLRANAKVILSTIERDIQMKENDTIKKAQLDNIEYFHELQIQYDFDNMIGIAQDIQNCLANGTGYAYNLELLYNFFEKCKLITFTNEEKLKAFYDALAIKKHEIMQQTNIALKHRTDKFKVYQKAIKGSTEHNEISMRAKIAIVKKYLKELTISQLQVQNCFTIYNF